MRHSVLVAFAVAVFIGAIALLGGYLLFSNDRSTASASRDGYPMMAGHPTLGRYGSGMMGGLNMMGNGYSGQMMMGGVGGIVQTSATPAELASVRDRVESALNASGYSAFEVAEIMAFTRNDYVLINGGSGKPAFELLVDPKGRWVAPEPGPNMMWNTRYGMMRGVASSGGPFPGGNGDGLTDAEATARADEWLADRYPGSSAQDTTSLPGYFTVDVGKDGRTIGMLSVNQRTGAVWYHTWHGEFVADRDF